MYNTDSAAKRSRESTRRTQGSLRYCSGSRMSVEHTSRTHHSHVEYGLRRARAAKHPSFLGRTLVFTARHGKHSHRPPTVTQNHRGQWVWKPSPFLSFHLDDASKLLPCKFTGQHQGQRISGIVKSSTIRGLSSGTNSRLPDSASEPPQTIDQALRRKRYG